MTLEIKRIPTSDPLKEDLQLTQLPRLAAALKNFNCVAGNRGTDYIRNYPLITIGAEEAWCYGPLSDRVVELTPLTYGPRGGLVETGYYVGSGKPKSIVKVSTEVGCVGACGFCPIGGEPFMRNLTGLEMYEQAILMWQVALELGINIDGPQKVSFTGSGEPLANANMVDALELLGAHGVSFKISTTFPSSLKCRENFSELAAFAGRYPGTIQIQASLFASSEEYRGSATRVSLLSLSEIADAAAEWRRQGAARSQFNLSFTLTKGVPVDGRQLRTYFDPQHFRVRMRPYIPNEHGKSERLEPIESEELAAIVRSCRSAGYYVSLDGVAGATEQHYNLSSTSNIMRVKRRRQH